MVAWYLPIMILDMYVTSEKSSGIVQRK
jgi:hypothetical protein